MFSIENLNENKSNLEENAWSGFADSVSTGSTADNKFHFVKQIEMCSFGIDGK